MVLTTKKRVQGCGALILTVVLALIFLLGQVLGLLHGTVHGPSSATVPGVSAAPERGVPGRDLERVFSRLFSAHQEAADCRLYDQSSHGDLVPGVPVLALPVVVPFFVFFVFSGLAVARWHALFQARGPPSVH